MIEILGSSVSALVATERLLAAGIPVRRTPSGRPSPFAPRVLPDGRTVEVGCKLLELSYAPGDGVLGRTGAGADGYRGFEGFLPTQDPKHRHLPFIAEINEYVSGLVDVGAEVERVAVRDTWSGVDPFLSGDPTCVADLLNPDEIEEAIWQVSQAVGRTFWQRIETFGDSVAAQCGPTIWEALFWPLVNKIAGWAEIPRGQHRKVWLPLWEPQSLLDALRGEPSYRPVRPMHFGVGALYEALEAATKDATVSPIDGFNPLGGPPSILYDYNSFGPQVRLPDAWRPPSVPIGVAWYEEDHPDGVEWLIDADNPVFRRTWRDGICCVEHAAGANVDRWAYDMSFTILDRCEARVPLGDVVCDDVRAVGYGSLNDQLVMGLAAADRLIREKG